MDLTRRGLIARGAAAACALMGGSLLAPRMVFAGESGEAVAAMRLPRSGRLETRRAFMEAVLSSVTAGVIALDSANRILLMNRSAEGLLQKGQEDLEGKALFARIACE